MTLDSKVDKSLIRYLKKISIKNTKSICDNSFYFTVLDDSNEILIRFSNHISPQGKYPINIVKGTDSLYQVYVHYLPRTVYEDDLVSYVKSLLPGIPMLLSNVKHYEEVNKYLRRELSKLNEKVEKCGGNKTIKNLKEDLRAANETIDKQKEQIRYLSARLSVIRDKCISLQTKVNDFVKFLE